MEENKNQFSALTPEVLDDNKEVYNDALDYALSNTDIRNIAITGIYGAGKSTVWNTYVNKRGLKNIITISLGKYNDGEEIEINDDLVDTEAKKYNRIERQIINQIVSQIDSKNISLSKYRYKENKTRKTIFIQTILTMSFIVSILLWMVKKYWLVVLHEFNIDSSIIMTVLFLLFIVPIFYFMWSFYKNNDLKISKINLKGTEASFNVGNDDETILDRDIKEIVYLLENSDAQIVVFEDLDRYDDIKIFTKLRELNFLVNAHIKSRGEDRKVRFIYMVKDGMFHSKDRTKFFDFIIPIVPIIDSKTSENELISLFRNVNNKPDERVLINTAMYIDDMRLLRNIVNEYIVYSKVIPINVLNLDKNKLFGLIILKNVFPNEFDLLQKDEGYIKGVFEKLEKQKEILIDKLKNDISNYQKEINKLSENIQYSKFEEMALLIPSSVHSSKDDSWPKFLKEWSLNETETKFIYSSRVNKYYSYKEFLEELIPNYKEIEDMPSDKVSKLCALNQEMQEKQAEIKRVNGYRYEELIFNMVMDDIDDLFVSQDANIINDHYFPLIRFLIVNGLLDETYCYYKGIFDIDNPGSLQKNDTLYLKGLVEKRKLDIFLRLENPSKVINHMSDNDYNKPNALNKTILEYCLDNKNDKVLLLADSVDIHDSYIDLARILDTLDSDQIKKYTELLVKYKSDFLIKVLNTYGNENKNGIMNILVALCIDDHISSEQLKVFKPFINNHAEIVNIIDEKDLSIFFDNISKINVKFLDLNKIEFDKEKWSYIEKTQTYELTVPNVNCLIDKVLGSEVVYGGLIRTIYQSELLVETKANIENNFEEFIIQYIDLDDINDVYFNSEEILKKIICSNISETYKLEYIKKNKTIITDIDGLKITPDNQIIFNELFNENIIELNENNLKLCWNMIDKDNEYFIDYIDRNINENNYESILKDNIVICNSLINNPYISSELFSYSLNFANDEIKNINTELSNERVNELVRKNLIAVTDENIKMMLSNSYEEELVLLSKSKDSDDKNEVIDILVEHKLEDKLIYKLINSGISDDNAIKLLDYLSENIDISKLDSSNKNIVERAFEIGLDDKNIKYVCEHFKTFNSKEAFIKYLERENKISELEDECLNESIVMSILSNIDVSTDDKVELLKKIIHNRPSIDLLKKYISSVDEIKELATVWITDKTRYPALDNDYKMEIAQALDDENMLG